MAAWEWLTKYYYNWRFVRNVALKTVVLFVALNLIYALLNPLATVSRFTFYNLVFPGRERLPFAENPEDAYSISLHRIEGIFASHIIRSEEKAADEFRVVLLGDSSVWGWLLDTDETLSACLNSSEYHTADGRRVRVYNLGYPVTSVMKDILIMEEALQYEPDAVVWLTTLQALYKDEQLRHPIMQNNPDRARDLIQRYDLDLDTSALPDEPSFWERTIVGQRRELADLLRHQVYGLAWWATGVDHVNPKFYEARIENLQGGENIPTRPNIEIRGYLGRWLSFDVIDAGVQMAAADGVPVLIINQPSFETDGLYSDLRYNDLYPKWAYNQFVELFEDKAIVNGWHYRDSWQDVPDELFTDYPLHYTADATCDYAALIATDMLALAE